MKKLIDIIDTTNEPNILQKMEWGGSRKNSGAKPKYNEQTNRGFGPTKQLIQWKSPTSNSHSQVTGIIK